MSNSIGDVNVMITADAGGVGPAVQQAQREFNKLGDGAEINERKFKKLSKVGASAAVSVTEAFSAGGIRNIGEAVKLLGEFSLLAGGPLAIGLGAFAAGNFIAKWFNDAAESAKHLQQEAAKAYEIVVNRGASKLAGQAGLQNAILSLRPGETTQEDLRNGQIALAKLRNELTAKNLFLQENQFPQADEKKEEIRKQRISETQEAIRALKEQIQNQNDLNIVLGVEVDKRNRLIQVQQHLQNAARFRGFRPFINQSERNATGLAAESVDLEIAGLKENLRALRAPDLSLWSRLPAAFGIGSSGAVGALNQAAIGPKNIQPPTEKTQLEIARDLRLLRQAEERKKSLSIEVIGIP